MTTSRSLLRVLEQHNHERMKKSLEGDASTAKNDLDRSESLAALKLVAREQQIRAQRRGLMRQKQQFRWATRMLKECKIYAPHDGQVVYASQRDSDEPDGGGREMSGSCSRSP